MPTPPRDRQELKKSSGGSIDDGWGQVSQRGISRPYQDVLNFVPRAVAGAGTTAMPWAL
jgi:hypothetical protein